MPMNYRVGIDVGGTFTDCVLVRPKGSLALTKVSTTPSDQSQGVLAGIEQLARIEGLGLRDLLAQTEIIVHGTTTLPSKSRRSGTPMRRRRGAIAGGGASAGSQMSSLKPRRSSISSRCPCVVISPVVAPLISIIVLSAVVVP